MQFYYADQSQQKGPATLEQLRAAGVTSQTLVWREGMADWQPAGAVPELASLFAAAEPAAPVVAAPPTFQQPPTFEQPHAGSPMQLPYAGYSGGYLQAGYPGAYTAPPSQGMSIASLVLGILAIPATFCYGAGFLFAILAVIFGHIGYGQYKRQTGQASGMAIAGLICGYLSLLVVAIVFLFVIAVIQAASSGGRGGY